MSEDLVAVSTTDDVVIDVSEVRFFGAAAITLLLELRTRLRQEGHLLHLAAVPRVVHRPLALLALLDVLPCQCPAEAATARSTDRPVTRTASP